MNFDFSDDQNELRREVRRFLESACPPAKVRQVLEGAQPYDQALWKEMAELGYLGIAIPEAYGGLGAGHLDLCVVAEELGRVLAPTPFSSSVYMASEALLIAGDEAQKSRWLPRLASGAAIGAFALVEPFSGAPVQTVSAKVVDGRLTGSKAPVADGDVADLVIVAARDGVAADAPIGLYLVDLSAAGVTRQPLETIDLTRSHARIEFHGAQAEPLGAPGQGQDLISAIYDRAAVLTAFEQVGGAERALEMARDYALERVAFGRPIGSFQAVKHMLADMFVSATLARSNAYYGAWALSTGAAELPLAAAIARVSASQAFVHCAQNNIQTHGGMGFTWAFDCHLYHRRAHLLALNLGGQFQWQDRLVSRLAPSPSH